ncbi:ABC transporter substrate-binding protein [Spirochaetia bacterium]|nr:ABC transporter substrate-binding protein [Spirochaetia bacterium]
MKKFFRVSFLCVFVLLIALTVSCKGGSSKAAPAADSTAVAAGAAPGSGYPVKTDVTLTYWIDLNSANVAPNFTSMNDTEFSKYLEEETGIKINFISPAVGAARDSFNLLVASGNMPDMIDYNWNTGYPGGPAAAITNKVIIPLNSLLETHAPDTKALFDANPSYDKMIKTDDGNYYIFPVMKLDDYLNTTYGLFIRQDWLDELNLKSPVTIDDWYNVLTAFKTRKGAEFPLTYPGAGGNFGPFANGMLIGAYGITRNWFIQDGKAVHGIYTPAYKDWLLTMAKWYKEGLFDNNFATNDQVTVDSNLINGESGASAFWIGSGLGKYLPALRATNPKATLAATTYPVLKEGDTPQFNSLLNPFDGWGAVITTSCKYPEIAARFLNYGYTEKGRKTYNYGREGISYTINNGVVDLLPVVTQSPLGWPLGQAWSKYAHGVYPGPYFSERRFLELYYPYPEQLAALDAFTATNMRAHLMPPVSPTPAEASEFARIMTNVNAYADEYTLTAIMGTVDINSTYDTYTAQLKRLGMDRAIEIQQGALERYTDR